MTGAESDRIEAFIAAWRDTGGSELANTQSFVNGLCDILGVPSPDGSRADDVANDYIFERRVFADNGDGTTSFGRIDCYRRGAFILEAKQGSHPPPLATIRNNPQSARGSCLPSVPHPSTAGCAR